MLARTALVLACVALAAGLAAGCNDKDGKPAEEIAKARQEEYAAGSMKCANCGHVYDPDVEGEPFLELGDDWTCPKCGSAKQQFQPVAAEGDE
jgi:rubredoxin